MQPSKDWKETVAADEHERFERYATQLAALQRKRAGASKADRALHAKAHAGVRARLEVLGGLPEHARVALFAEPKTLEAYVRFSNGAGTRDSDRKPDLRGLAIKVLGVGGRKLIPGMENETTQDFLFVNVPALPFATVEDFVAVVLASSTPALLPFRLFGHFGFGTLGFLKRLLAATKPIPSLATASFYSVAPIRFGDLAVRLSLAPAQHGDGPERHGSTLADDLAGRLAAGELAWDLRVQFFTREAATPIEDVTVAWSESESPPVVVARLSIPGQDVASDEGRRLAERVEAMAFDPWHACEELRPLGAAMRARNPAYRESQKTRRADREPST